MKNGVTTSLLFFLFENAKNLGRSDDGKRRKKTGWPHCKENATDNIFPTMYANASEGKQNLFFSLSFTSFRFVTQNPFIQLS